jgi:hypothetical protein
MLEYPQLEATRESILATLVQQRNQFVYENQSWLMEPTASQALAQCLD